MKKTYIIPTMTVMTLSHSHQLLAGSPQEGIGSGEQGNGSALSRGNSFWDDDE